MFFFFKIYVILKGEHSAQTVYDIGWLGLKNLESVFLKFILFQNSYHIEGEQSAQAVYDIG